jgi:hypothetical protein
VGAFHDISWEFILKSSECNLQRRDERFTEGTSRLRLDMRALGSPPRHSLLAVGRSLHASVATVNTYSESCCSHGGHQSAETGHASTGVTTTSLTAGCGAQPTC